MTHDKHRVDSRHLFWTALGQIVVAGSRLALRPAPDARRRPFGRSRSGRFTSSSRRWSLQSQHQALEEKH